MARFHARRVTKLVAGCQGLFATNPEGDAGAVGRYDPRMVTKPRPPAKPQTRRRLYIAEWMAKFELSDQALGDIMGLPRQTIYRWRTQHHRVTPDKQAAIAEAIGIEPEQLWRPPGRRSIDAMLAKATPEQLDDAADFVERFVLKP